MLDHALAIFCAGVSCGFFLALPFACWMVSARLDPFKYDRSRNALEVFGQAFHLDFFKSLAKTLPVGQTFHIFDRRGVVIIGHGMPRIPDPK